MPEIAQPVPGLSVRRYLTQLRRDIRPALDVRAVSGTTHRGPAGTTLYPRATAVDAFPWDKVSFGHTLAYDAATAKTTCTIYPGTVRLHGLGQVALAASSDIILAGNPCWVFFMFSRVAALPGTITLTLSTNEPVSSPNIMRIPLRRFDATTAGQYALGRICVLGDINLDTPIR